MGSSPLDLLIVLLVVIMIQVKAQIPPTRPLGESCGELIYLTRWSCFRGIPAKVNVEHLFISNKTIPYHFP